MPSYVLLRLRTIMAAGVLFVLAGTAGAETLYFVYQTSPTVDQDWLSPSNWFTLDGGGNPTVPANRIPTSADTAVLGYLAKLTGSTSVGTLEVNAGGRLDGGSLAADSVVLQGKN